MAENLLLLSFGSDISPQLHEQVMLAKQAIEAHPFEGFLETVPAYNSLAVYFNPPQMKETADTATAIVEAAVRQILSGINPEKKQTGSFPVIEIPVCYDEEFGIDLEELSQIFSLSIEEIIQLHSSKTYKVFMTGFTPGFPYMGTVHEKLISKRKAQPRIKVEAGAVAIAGHQTGIYPMETPGGWNIIGRTPLKIFDAKRNNPFLLKAGDEVRFVPLTKDEFYQTPPAVTNPGGGSHKSV